jgi:hypothetical protein
MIESATIPTDSDSFILAHLETERSYYEAAESDKQFDEVVRHAARVREWLSSIDLKSAHLSIDQTPLIETKPLRLLCDARAKCV